MADEEEFEIDKPDIAMRFLSQAPPLQFPPVLDGTAIAPRPLSPLAPPAHPPDACRL